MTTIEAFEVLRNSDFTNKETFSESHGKACDLVASDGFIIAETESGNNPQVAKILQGKMFGITENDSFSFPDPYKEAGTITYKLYDDFIVASDTTDVSTMFIVKAVQ